jgi:hypothetical protein
MGQDEWIMLVGQVDGFLEALFADIEIPDELREASDHEYLCRCERCLDWWVAVGPEDYTPEGAPLYGPFTADEVEARREELKAAERIGIDD